MINSEGILTLEDENGKLLKMQVIELLEYNFEKYVLLQDPDEEDDNSYIFKFIEDKEYDKLESIEDEKEREHIFKLFEKKICGSSHIN